MIHLWLSFLQPEQTSINSHQINQLVAEAELKVDRRQMCLKNSGKRTGVCLFVQKIIPLPNINTFGNDTASNIPALFTRHWNPPTIISSYDVSLFNPNSSNNCWLSSTALILGQSSSITIDMSLDSEQVSPPIALRTTVGVFGRVLIWLNVFVRAATWPEPLMPHSFLLRITIAYEFK